MLLLSAIVALVAICSVSSTALRGSGTCSVADSDRLDCGYYGIQQTECQNKGCCWASSSVSGAPWCFYPAGTNPTCFNYQASLSEPFTTSEVSTMHGFFFKNINIEGKGGVVAAPDYNTPGGSYYYHWMRDGALTMRAVQETNTEGFGAIINTVKAYAQWVVHNQNEHNPNGQDIRTEPKFMLPNGEVFTDPWCRPQNDGPGLRATTLIMAAQNLIAAGEQDFVKQYLWTGSDSNIHGGAIKFDLDYVVSGYASNTCDLWEEVRDPDFFWNRVTMKKAMIVGAAFAKQMGDSASADKYLNTLKAINSTLYSNHYNGKYVLESNGRPQDAAVILGFNDGYDESDGMFAPTSLEVAQTVASYNTLFCSEYAINNADTAKALPGVLYGRYKGDTYAGGNPWVLATAALANLFYRGAAHVLDHGVPSAAALSAWKTAMNSASDLPTSPAALAKVFAAQGDGVLLRLRYHVQGKGFHLDEQLDRNTGIQISAKDLTWSYAEVLNAMTSRNIYLSKAK